MTKIHIDLTLTVDGPIGKDVHRKLKRELISILNFIIEVAGIQSLSWDGDVYIQND